MISLNRIDMYSELDARSAARFGPGCFSSTLVLFGQLNGVGDGDHREADRQMARDRRADHEISLESQGYVFRGKETQELL